MRPVPQWATGGAKGGLHGMRTWLFRDGEKGSGTSPLKLGNDISKVNVRRTERDKDVEEQV